MPPEWPTNKESNDSPEAVKKLNQGDPDAFGGLNPQPKTRAERAFHLGWSGRSCVRFLPEGTDFQFFHSSPLGRSKGHQALGWVLNSGTHHAGGGRLRWMNEYSPVRKGGAAERQGVSTLLPNDQELNAPRPPTQQAVGFRSSPLFQGGRGGKCRCGLEINT
jgi:hypothetical protein